MTKKFLPLTLTILTVGLISYALLNPVIANSLGAQQKENQTIEIYKNLLKISLKKKLMNISQTNLMTN